MAKVKNLDDEKVHKKIKKLVKQMLMLEVEYMDDEEIEDVVHQMKELAKIKLKNKKAKVNKEIYNILREKLMYDIEDVAYVPAAKASIALIEKILAKVAKVVERKLSIIIGVKRGGIIGTCKMIRDVLKSEDGGILTREEINNFIELKKSIREIKKQQLENVQNEVIQQPACEYIPMPQPACGYMPMPQPVQEQIPMPQPVPLHMPRVNNSYANKQRLL